MSDKPSNFYELEAQATAAPWAVIGSATTDDGWICSGKVIIGEFSGECLPCPTLAESDINMRLAIHCRNNFKAALLELKAAQEKLLMYAQGKKPAGTIGWHIAEAQRLGWRIEEMEKVP